MTDPGRVRSAEQFVVELTVHKLQEDKLLQGTLNSIVIVVWPSDQGQATDIMIHAEETLKLKKRLNDVYVKHTGQTLKKVEAALERDNFMSAEDAKKWGLIDEIVTNRAMADEADE